MHNGRRQPSCGGTSRMMREYQVRICERLGVKFPGPTRQSRRGGRSHTIVYVRFALIATESMRRENPPLRAIRRHMQCSKIAMLLDHLVGASE